MVFKLRQEPFDRTGNGDLEFGGFQKGICIVRGFYL